MDQEDIRYCLEKIAQQGDVNSFKEIYSHYFIRLLKLSYTIVHSRESAEEIVNDVFVKLWKKKKELASINKPDVYFYIAVKNKSLDYLRKQNKKKVLDLALISASHLRTSTNPETIMLTNELRDKIKTAIDQLPARCKLIFKLVKEDGLKYKEAAAVLDLSIKTIEAQLAIATKKLSQTLLNTDMQKKKSHFL